MMQFRTDGSTIACRSATESEPRGTIGGEFQGDAESRQSCQSRQSLTLTSVYTSSHSQSDRLHVSPAAHSERCTAFQCLIWHFLLQYRTDQHPIHFLKFPVSATASHPTQTLDLDSQRYDNSRMLEHTSVHTTSSEHVIHMRSGWNVGDQTRLWARSWASRRMYSALVSSMVSLVACFRNSTSFGKPNAAYSEASPVKSLMLRCDSDAAIMARLSSLFERIARAGVHVKVIMTYGLFRPTDRLTLSGQWPRGMGDGGVWSLNSLIWSPARTHFSSRRFARVFREEGFHDAAAS